MIPAEVVPVALPANDTVPGPAPVMVWEIRDKDRTRFGVRHPGELHKGHHAEIIPGERIRLFGVERFYRVNPATGRREMVEETYLRDYQIGSPALVSGYNLDYIGVVRKITEKTITVVEDAGTSHEKVYRFDIAAFDWKNWDFDVARSLERNRNWSD